MSKAGPLPEVVIVGGGFAGLDAARALRHARATVTIVDRRNHHVFQPLLYQVAAAALSPGDIASPIRWILRRQDNVRVLLADVVAVDAAGKTLVLDGGQRLGFDYLILAMGAAHSYFGHDNWSEFAPGLKTLDDALKLRRKVLLAFEEAEREPDPDRKRHLLTFVLIGGGPTGVELAGALAEIAHHSLRREFDAIDPESARIILLEGGDTILPTFPQSLRDSARRALRKLGVEVRERALVTAIEPESVAIGPDRLHARSIIWTARSVSQRSS
jgi:NADH dehydrogenase